MMKWKWIEGKKQKENAKAMNREGREDEKKKSQNNKIICNSR